MASEASGTRSQLRWERHRRTFEEYLRELRFTDESRLRGLEEAMRYSMLAGGKRVRPTLCMEVARELAGSTGVNGMVGGQIMDVDQTGVGARVDLETLHMIHKYKTGALIKSSARIGAILAGAGHEGQVAVSEYASELGLCFQIVDDVLNATSTREELGKSAGSDAEQGKATFVSVYGLEGAQRQADNSVGRALDALDTIDGDTSGLRQMAL